MDKLIKAISFSFIFSLLSVNICSAQDNVVDNIIAVVGDKVILKSDLENKFMIMQQQAYDTQGKDLKSSIFEDLLVEKLMLAQAKIDSISAEPKEVNSQLDRKLQGFIQRIGSEEKLVEYFKKSLAEIKSDFYEDTRNEIIKQKMQAEISKNVSVTPAEVREYYRTFPKDSLPMMPALIEVAQIVKQPKASLEEKNKVRNRLKGFRKQILDGKSFATLAVLYSEDPGSAQRGGELGYMPVTSFVPEFAAEAANLKKGKISKIVETEYGFHILKLVDRRGDKLNLKHILIKPKVSEELREEAKNILDSIANSVRNKKVTFSDAAFYASDDKNTRNNGGLLVNPYTGNSKFEKDALPASISKNIQNLKLNEISDPFLDAQSGSEKYVIVKIISEIKEHKANIDDDWTVFENILIRKRQSEVMTKWITKKQKSTYVHIGDAYKNSEFNFEGWFK